MFKTILAAAALALVSAPATAQTAPTRNVEVGDLDLASAKGRATLDDRIRWAVKAVCGTANSSDPKDATRVYKCRKAAGVEARHSAELAIARTQQLAAERLAAR